MKKLIKQIFVSSLVTMFFFASCKKDKKTPDPSEPPVTNPVNEQEVITTLRIYLWDSISGAQIAGSPFSFKDPDGEGGLAGGFLNNGLDSLILLSSNTVYKTRVIILDETKNPADSTSNEIGGEESHEHMLFYNGNPLNSSNASGNSIIHPGHPNYTVKLNGSDIRIRYADSDNGASNNKPTRNTGLETYLKTSAVTTTSYPFIITLKHQPDEKDGTFAPGETDVEVQFKIRVN